MTAGFTARRRSGRINEPSVECDHRIEYFAAGHGAVFGAPGAHSRGVFGELAPDRPRHAAALAEPACARHYHPLERCAGYSFDPLPDLRRVVPGHVFPLLDNHFPPA